MSQSVVNALGDIKDSIDNQSVTVDLSNVTSSTVTNLSRPSMVERNNSE